VNLNLAETGLNWDTVLKAIPVVAAVLGALYKLRDSRPRRRATLKADLELLGAAREQKLDCRELEARVQADLSHLANRGARTDWWAVAAGSVLATVFGLWTVYLVRADSRGGRSPAVSAFVGLSIVIAGLEETRPDDAKKAGDRSLGKIEPPAGSPAVRR
jgi:hypothetical protein